MKNTRLDNVLAAERARLGWSQARMAEAAGISRQGYAAIEAGSAGARRGARGGRASAGRSDG